jgi:hypothetical protein
MITLTLLTGFISKLGVVAAPVDCPDDPFRLIGMEGYSKLLAIDSKFTFYRLGKV